MARCAPAQPSSTLATTRRRLASPNHTGGFRRVRVQARATHSACVTVEQRMRTKEEATTSTAGDAYHEWVSFQRADWLPVVSVAMDDEPTPHSLSTVGTTYAVQTPTPPPVENTREKGPDFYLNAGDAIRTLRRELPALFQQDLTCKSPLPRVSAPAEMGFHPRKSSGGCPSCAYWPHGLTTMATNGVHGVHSGRAPLSATPSHLFRERGGGSLITPMGVSQSHDRVHQYQHTS
jgi:hypothetical protein